MKTKIIVILIFSKVFQKITKILNNLKNISKITERVYISFLTKNIHVFVCAYVNTFA